MPANLENTAVATRLEKVSFIPIPKKGNAKECSNYCTIALISQASKVMLKIINFQMFKLVLEKAEEPEIKLPTSAGSSKKQESSRKNICFCLIDYAKASDCVDHNKLWKTENSETDHLTCLLRNLYAGQEATDWFQKGICQGCILSPCLFNLYAEYIMRNTGLDKGTSWNQDCQEKHQ